VWFLPAPWAEQAIDLAGHDRKRKVSTATTSCHPEAGAFAEVFPQSSMQDFRYLLFTILGKSFMLE